MAEDIEGQQQFAQILKSYIDANILEKLPRMEYGTVQANNRVQIDGGSSVLSVTGLPEVGARVAVLLMDGKVYYQGRLI